MASGSPSLTRSSSREVRIRGPTFFWFVYFSMGALPEKRNGQRALLGDLVELETRGTAPQVSGNGLRFLLFGVSHIFSCCLISQDIFGNALPSLAVSIRGAPGSGQFLQLLAWKLQPVRLPRRTHRDRSRCTLPRTFLFWAAKLSKPACHPDQQT